MTADAFDTWLNRSQTSLDEALDIEAGLREILLQSDHEARIEGLGDLLNEEAGLADIVKPVHNPPEQPVTIDTSAMGLMHAGEGHQLNRFLGRSAHGISPQDRMRMRGAAGVRDAVRAASVGQAHADHIEALERISLRSHDPAVSYSLTPQLEALFVFTLSLSQGEGQSRRQDLTLCRSSLRELTALFAHGQVRTGPKIDRALAQLTSALLLLADAAVEWRFNIDAMYKDVREVHLRNVLSLLSYANGVVQGAEPTGDQPLHSELATAAGTARALVGNCLNAVEREVMRFLGVRIRITSAEEAQSLIHDFTVADLREANLDGIDLSGVRWSEHNTRWPASVDIETLKTESEETPADSGFYVVRSGTATIRDLTGRA
ncbi:hypothetical protein [Streptomyces sp. HUAS TT7]|uniref:hypothetical protein n=1 Tax=Streptomyces sp. HUAS TT7 TaxID=3447507 RepID=UPI003F6607FC